MPAWNTMTFNSLEAEILHLKKETDTLILAHYYEDGEIQDVADGVGDSLYLAQVGEKGVSKSILLAGVVFMAESVKILAPDKSVLAPDLSAGCSLVQSSPYEKFRKWREKFPDHISVTYVNSSAEVKSISDVICTSSNAEKIIASIPKNRGILFAPDKNLGRYLAKKTGRHLEIWDGSCEVHVLFSAQELFNLKRRHPGAVTVAHPECDETVLAQADVIGSTSALLKEVTTGTAKTYIVATEEGILHQMKKVRPDALLIQAPTAENCGCNRCPYMRLNTLEKIRNTLITRKPEISLSTSVIDKAKIPLNRMMTLTNNGLVDWPTSFNL